MYFISNTAAYNDLHRLKIQHTNFPILLYKIQEGYDCGTFRPTLDGTFITDYPMVLRERKEYNKVPEMIGTNADDGSMLMLFGKVSLTIQFNCWRLFTLYYYIITL